MSEDFGMTLRSIPGRALIIALLLAIAAPVALAQKGVVRPHERIERPEERARERESRARQESNRYAIEGGYAHFDDFEERIDKHVAEQTARPRYSKFFRVGPPVARSKYSQAYITTSYRKSPMRVLIARLGRDGSLEKRFEWVPDGGATAAEMYVLAFGPKTADPVTKQLMIAEFNAMPLLADASLFHWPTSHFVPTMRLPVSYRPSLKLDPAQSIELSWKTNWSMTRDDFQMLAAKSEKDGETYFYPILKPPALLGLLPPDGYREHIAAISKTEFDKRQLSIFMLEGNTDARQQLRAAAAMRQISLAADLTTASQFGNAEMRALESAFAVRRGKTVAIVGHYEKETFFVRSNGQTTGSIPRATLLAWASKHDISLLLLGCETLSATADSQAQTVTPINSFEMAHSLIRASAANNWGDFFSELSSLNTPIVMGSPRKNETNTYDAALKRRLPDGRLYTIARISYQIRCAVMATC